MGADMKVFGKKARSMAMVSTISSRTSVYIMGIGKMAIAVARVYTLFLKLHLIYLNFELKQFSLFLCLFPQGTMVWADGSKFVGLWKDDKRLAEHAVMYEPDGTLRKSDWPHQKPYDNYFVEEESIWETRYRTDINRRRLEALLKLKQEGKLPYPIREDLVLDPEGFI